MTFHQPTNPESESPQAWAQRVWASWTPMERGEFVGAVEIIMEANRGGGAGSFAQKRRPRTRQKNHYDGGKHAA